MVLTRRAAKAAEAAAEAEARAIAEAQTVVHASDVSAPVTLAASSTTAVNPSDLTASGTTAFNTVESRAPDILAERGNADDVGRQQTAVTEALGEGLLRPISATEHNGVSSRDDGDKASSSRRSSLSSRLAIGTSIHHAAFPYSTSALSLSLRAGERM